MRCEYAKEKIGMEKMIIYQFIFIVNYSRNFILRSLTSLTLPLGDTLLR